MKLDLPCIKDIFSDCSVLVNGNWCKGSAVSDEHLSEHACCTTDCHMSINSQTIKPGQVFLALKGQRHDAHTFLKTVLAKGASALIINESERQRLKRLDKERLKKTMVVLVSDTLKALFALARVWRARFSFPIVGITGSVGKTTTKEMLRSIADAARVPLCFSYKNQNTEIGMCLNILKMRTDHKAAVFEMGISESGEMARKSDLLRPTFAVITNIGHSHLKGLGTVTDIAREKRDIFKFFTHENVGIINGDQEILHQSSYVHPVVRFGLKTKNQVQARKIRTHNQKEANATISFVLKLYDQKGDVQLNMNHSGYVYNALAASTVAHFLKIPFDRIVAGLKKYAGGNSRFEILALPEGLGTVVNDCYNASPESMRGALLAFHEMKAGGAKIAVLGDMLELGEKEDFWHRQVGRILGKTLSIDIVLLVGRRAKEIGKTAPITMRTEWARDWKVAKEKLMGLLKNKNSLVLVKASNGVGLENMVKEIIE